MQSTLSEPNYSQEIRRFLLKTRSCTHIPIGSQNFISNYVFSYEIKYRKIHYNRFLWKVFKYLWNFPASANQKQNGNAFLEVFSVRLKILICIASWKNLASEVARRGQFRSFLSHPFCSHHSFSPKFVFASFHLWMKRLKNNPWKRGPIGQGRPEQQPWLRLRWSQANIAVDLTIFKTLKWLKCKL